MTEINCNDCTIDRKKGPGVENCIYKNRGTWGNGEIPITETSQ